MSHLVEGLRPDVDGASPPPWDGTLAGGLLTLDEQGCLDCDADSCRNVSSQVLKEAMAGDNVKGVDYRTVGRMALSAVKRKEGSRTLLQ